MITHKSKAFIKVEYPQPVDTLLSLIEVMKDPKAFDKHLKAIKDYTDKANSAVETLCKAEKVESLLNDTEAKNKLASEQYDKASQTAAKVLSDAEEKAAILTAQSKLAAQEMLSHAETANKEAIQREKDAKARESELKTLQAQLDAANQAQQKRQADLDKRESEIKRKEAILSQLAI